MRSTKHFHQQPNQVLAPNYYRNINHHVALNDDRNINNHINKPRDYRFLPTSSSSMLEHLALH